MVLRGHPVSTSQYIFRRQSISFPSHPLLHTKQSLVQAGSFLKMWSNIVL
jgi:hypothetical protein